MNIQTALLFVTASVNCLLSLLVLLGKRDKTNIIYSIFVLFASLWAVGLAFFFMENDLNRTLHIINFYYIAAAGIPIFFLYFSLIFLNKEGQKFSKTRLLLILPWLLMLAAFIYDKNFLIKVVFEYEGNKDVILNNFNYLIFSAYFLVFVCLSYYKLLNLFNNTQNIEERNQLKFIIGGTFIGFTFGMVFNLILPFFGDYRHIYLGPLFSFSMVASIAYSITRHHLFNMKVIVTEILMFILWVFIFIRLILSTTLEDQVISGGLLAITVFVGIFLIRSVIKEVKLREEVQKLAEDLKEANESQASLMHFMNHQVKGRFGNARNVFAELLTDDYGVMPDSAKPLLEKGLEETKMGVDYVQNILKGASAESGKLPYNMTQIDFKPVVEDVFNKQKDYAEKKGLEFKLHIDDGDYKMTGDNVELGESIRNLLDNSINYTEKGSINVTLKNTGNIIHLEIKDTGVGLSDDDKTKLFKAGGRGKDSLKVNVNSTGYGLVFVKGVIEAHKGRVWAESEGCGYGSTFLVELPKLEHN